MEKQLTNQLDEIIKADPTINSGVIVDQYGFQLASKNFDQKKAYLIKNIADASSRLRPDDDQPKVVIETVNHNTIIQPCRDYYVALNKQIKKE